MSLVHRLVFLILLLPAVAGASQCLRPGGPPLIGAPAELEAWPSDDAFGDPVELDKHDPFIGATRAGEGRRGSAPRVAGAPQLSLCNVPLIAACRGTPAGEASWYARRSLKRPAYYAIAPPPHA